MIEAQGELAGHYRYSIDQLFLLVQQRTFSLPFVQAKMELEKCTGLESNFQGQSRKGKVQRKYRIRSDKFLPRRVITIRDDGKVVGQTSLTNLSQGEKQETEGSSISVQRKHSSAKFTVTSNNSFDTKFCSNIAIPTTSNKNNVVRTNAISVDQLVFPF